MKLLASIGGAVLGLALFAASPFAQSGRIDIFKLLDHYAAAEFDAALRPVAAATQDQVRDMRAQLARDARTWIDADFEQRRGRAFAAATFALEFETTRAELGEWTPQNSNQCGGRCIVEWASAWLWHPMASDQPAHQWYEAVIALAGGVRDWTFLYTPPNSGDALRDYSGFAGRALARFPGDAQFRFARAMALASRFDPTTEQDAPQQGVRLDPKPALPLAIIPPGARVSATTVRREALRAALQAELAALAPDDVVGASASTKLAYLKWTEGRYEEAIAQAEKASAKGTRADDRYLAAFIAGLSAQSNGDLLKAETFYEAALKERRDSQSASIALAALRMQRGDAASAYDLSAATLSKRRDDDDPWRMYMYGDYPRLRELTSALRSIVKSGGAR